MRVFGWAVCGAVVMAAAGVGAYVVWERTSSPRALQRDIVRHHLVDPDSAVFRNDEPAYRGENVWCGEVNARNRMGGMAGFARYVVYIEEADPDDPGYQKNFSQVFLEPSDARAAKDDPTTGSAVFTSRWRLMCAQ